MKDWIEFYDSPHSIYVNARHRDVHYALLADDIADYVPSRDAVILDYGSGEALHADRIAKAARRLTLAEAAQTVRAHLIERFKTNPRITVVSTERTAVLPPASFDLVVMHSVSQYLSPQEFDRVLALFARLLKPGGVLLLGDVVPPQAAAISDAWALLRFGRHEGFLLAAITGLVRTVFSDYARLRSRIGLTRYAEPDLMVKLAAAGFTARRAPKNIGHLSSRMTFVAHRQGAAAS
jgi:SAM-dependent methyltransferase